MTCGDGVPELSEPCDDGNLVSGDGCDANARRTAASSRGVGPHYTH
ncbi:MAG: hypothetical protein KIT14_20825 [bacterium]|nr:hypothetical protein [bacterium]